MFTMSSRFSAPLRLLPVLGLAALVLAVMPASASARTIDLNLKGGYKDAMNTCAGRSNHYTYYRYNRWSSTLRKYVRNRVRIDGYLYPAPPYADRTWRVKVKVKKCKYVNGRWTFATVWEGHAFGNGVWINGVKYGRYKRAFRFRSKGYFFARAYYYRDTPYIQSSQEHFRVTR